MTPRVVAHRGLHRRHPENSVAAVKAAASAGCQGAEVDLRTLRDGTLVLSHDERLARRGPELSALNEVPAGVDLAQDFFEWAEERPEFELWLEAKTLEAARRVPSKVPSRCRATSTLISFDPAAVEHWAREPWQGRIGWIQERVTPATFARARALGADTIVARSRHLTPRLVREACSQGLRVATWGNRSRRRALALERSGLSTIIVDNPLRFGIRGDRTASL